tara:strand:+ start:750 stop:971 length:222 start_codon:yes stop_codon:yes gene_type:complete
MNNDDFKTIIRIPRDDSSELILKTGVYWKIPVADIRWYSNGNPTKKGIRVNMDELKQLTTALNTMLGDIDESN